MFTDNFIDRIIQDDIKYTKLDKIITRFPPEPNGYLHLGHIKSVALNYFLAKKYEGFFNLRYDDTNPITIEQDYYNKIYSDLLWLGFDPGERVFYASDYFKYFYECAVKLINLNKAYVCELSTEEIRINRGSLTCPGIESPYRNRSIEDNIFLLNKMKAGDFQEGICVLRAKINMQAGNVHLRDPVLYRIKKQKAHIRTRDEWCIYPSYDFSHPLSDYLESITHSICTLEFEDHRPLYNWILKTLSLYPLPKQIEFSRLNVENAITSKRKINILLSENKIQGLDDPHIHTIQGLKSRGYTPTSLVTFCISTAVSKQNSIISHKLLENTLCKELDKNAERRFVVQEPLKATVLNISESYILMQNHPKDSSKGSRKVSISNNIYIERSDFVVNPQVNEKKLTLHGYARLIGLGVVYCSSYKVNTNNEIIAVSLELTEINQNLQNITNLHWVDCVNHCTMQLYFFNTINSEYSRDICDSVAEKSLVNASLGDRFQFYRLGYFIICNKQKANCIVSIKYRS
jgi:glutaminyl-tRNA synthetase